MSTVEFNGVTVYVAAIESVEDGVSEEYNRLWDRAVSEVMLQSWNTQNARTYSDICADIDAVVFPNEADHPAVIVKLTSGREFRIVGKSREEVEAEILWAKRRDKS